MKKVHEELNFINNLRTVGQSALQLRASCLWIGLQCALDKSLGNQKQYIFLRIFI